MYGQERPTQHLELISILENRLPKGSRIQAGYLESKKQDNTSLKTWDTAMMRIIAVDTAARNAIQMSRSYGNPDIVHSFPSNAVPPTRSTKKRGSALLTREAEEPSRKGTLAVRTALDVPLVAAIRVCHSCGNPAHMLNDCPALYFTDTNSDYSCNWTDSVVGKTWLTNGEAMWQIKLIPRRYEVRERYLPAGSPPFLMCKEEG